MAVYEGTDTNVLPENSVLENFRIGEDPVNFEKFDSAEGFDAIFRTKYSEIWLACVLNADIQSALHAVGDELPKRFPKRGH